MLPPINDSAGKEDINIHFDEKCRRRYNTYVLFSHQAIASCIALRYAGIELRGPGQVGGTPTRMR
ncbi:uncharacterized protein EAE98_008978 [Botrytis deweyae]|uniref:Uncharacterized protein n=1 Tax=Botrytis deweyae TaxID=2478750 RepID=A0ABQ7ICM2_9HELO|nr:uncharacterized protein EAE98_008978 [Botrytis deweyae]KAF7920285.1 hypothetical protein EAE98_008978 [Botrytis deweyae]